MIDFCFQVNQVTLKTYIATKKKKTAVSNKCCSSEHSIYERILKKMHYCFHRKTTQ